MKRLYALIAVILVFLGFAFVQEGGDNKTARVGKPTVGILQLMSHPALDAIHHGILHGLKEKATRQARTLRLIFKTLKMIRVT